ncbi:related to GEF1 protein [Pseudozyma flocculosa]|uniref:Related to GEF1 protein n=1 Tax=Pseudozyma flocculosa TaxID=84751 RepID=A0A5C3F306_9BASI|nr:related to GEF1 protein [Pseudozyma flocculosa]
MDGGGLQLLPSAGPSPPFVAGPRRAISSASTGPTAGGLSFQDFDLGTFLGTHLSDLNGGSAPSVGGGFDDGSFGSSFGGGSSSPAGSRNGGGGANGGSGGAPGGNGFNGGGAGGSGSGGSGGDGQDADRAKKVNPLVDLMESESAYVSELSKIIKTVAAAWSRANFPPPELDAMFRCTEAIYRVNRSFLKALKEIGPNPSSPKALGDLLMRWIDDLEAPYTRFCESYLADFDSWPKVQSNPRLAELLGEISGATKADGTPVVFSDRRRDPNEPWTLDMLFALPHIRLKYYKKLYSRLLKSTQPGRSDHKLLVGANAKLDDLLDKSKRRLAMSVLDEAGGGRGSLDGSLSESNTTAETSPRGRGSSATSASEGNGPLSPSHKPFAFASKGLSPAGSPSSGALRHVGDTGPPTPLAAERRLEGGSTSASPSRPDFSRHNSSEAASSVDAVTSQVRSMAGPSKTDSMSQPIEALEGRLDTSRTLDIFTMKPKKCQLQMRPPNLPFERSLRKSADVVIHLTPSSGGGEIAIRRAHIFLLTDLFLVCERMTPSERAERSSGPGPSPDMWLLYPPLAGKHLRVADLGGQGNVLAITILKKERLIVSTESREAKEDWISHLEECQRFAGSMGLKVKTSSSLAPIANGATGSALPSPALSPSISVTPSTQEGPTNGQPPPPNINVPASPHSPVASGLGRHTSFNSVASFPKEAPSGSPDLRIPPLNSPGSYGSPRSPSPSQFAGPSPSYSAFGARPSGPLPGGSAIRPAGLMSPTPTLSPDNSPNFGPTRLGQGPNGPVGPGGYPSMGRPPMMANAPNGMAGPPPPRPPYGPGPPPQHANGTSPRGGPSPTPGGRAGMPNGSMMRPPPPPPPPADGKGWSPSPGLGAPPGHSREPLRRPSAPNLRDASRASSSNGHSDDGAEHSRSFGRSRSVSSFGSSSAPRLPSEMMKTGMPTPNGGEDPSPPSSPTRKNRGPTRSTVSAQMRCKIYLKQSHAQWKSLGNARLKLYHILPDDYKQLVVENDRKTLISTIVLSDGVERVGKVGVAVELSDQGNRTGIVYMLQMRSEESAGGLFGQLLEGSDRTALQTQMR